MFLCIDTATVNSGVAVVGDDKSVFLELPAMQASEKIMEMIDQAMRGSECRSADFEGVIVVKGPGSFTGLRVGIAIANQFAHQLGIPIVGLQTDELWVRRTDVKDFIYLQSMNRDQVYMVGFGRFARDFPQAIISISECHHELASESESLWFGQINEEHRKKLSDIQEVSDVRSAEVSWQKVAQDFNGRLKAGKKYELVEPFYGKEPTITKSNRKLGV